MHAVRCCGRDEVIWHGGHVFECAADEKDVVCDAEVGEVRVTVMLDKPHSLVVLVPFLCWWFHGVLQECADQKCAEWVTCWVPVPSDIVCFRRLSSHLLVVRLRVLPASACMAPQHFSHAKTS